MFSHTKKLPATITSDCMPANDDDAVIRETLINTFFKTEFQGKPLQELLEISKTISVQMSDNTIKLVEELTKAQHGNWLWEKQRVGRITGSTFKSACITNLKKPARSTIMKICYPEKCHFTSPQTSYGNKMELVARKMFIEKMEREHTNFTCNISGLVIDPVCNFFAVSPDGVCKCDCCGSYLVEIKCPYSLSSPHSSITDLLNLKNPYILHENNSLVINRKHEYFYQLQIQMAVCRVEFSYFYIWSQSIQVCVRVCFEQDFWLENSVKAFRFARNVIVPELMNSCYSKTYDFSNARC